MKKSQLRKIIRESIKQLMTEQTSCGSTCCNITYGYHCPNPPSTWQGITQGNGTSSGGTYWNCVTINGNPPIVGDTFRDSASNNGNAPGNGHVYEVLTISLPSSSTYARNFLDDLSCPTPSSQDHVCQDGNCLDCSVSMNTQYCNAPGATIYPDLAACQTVLAANKGRCPLECSATCDASAWSNHANWISTWTSLPNFTSSNPNQPCQHICQKITQWTATCANAGPVQQNQLACKIAEANNQHTIHNCSNSNANAC